MSSSQTAAKQPDPRRDRPRRPSADVTRRTLLDVGRARFARQGYAGTAVQDLLDDAGVTGPVLYHHFGNKLGLFVAVAEEVYTLFLAEMRRSVEPTTGFDQALNAMLDAAIRIHTSEPTMASMTLTVQIEVRRDDELARQLRPVLQSFRDFVDQLAARAPMTPDPRGQKALYRALAAIMNGLNSIAGNTDPEEFSAAVEAMRHLLNRNNLEFETAGSPGLR
ncbi:TetR/AcrR family transcriptional regulator [Mycobacterium sp. PDNC021]|uniref:TetR/AcrR family transcriptional regulator n=1 Tax=Mycobacterium sp. PDNC021 TaxID=3391399 RepID=UPI003AAB96E6